MAQNDDLTQLKAAFESETNTEEKVDLGIELAKAHIYIDVNETIRYADMILKLSQDAGYKSGEANSYLAKGKALHEMQNTFKAFSYYGKAENIFIETKNKLGEYIAKSNKQSMLFAIGLVSSNSESIRESIDNYRLFSKTLLQLGDSSQVCINYRNMAIGYSMLGTLGEVQNSLDSVNIYLSLAKRYNVDFKNPNYLDAELVMQKGAVLYANYLRTKQKYMLDKAKKQYEKAIKLFEEQGNTEKLFIAKGDLASIYFYKGNYVEAFKLSKKQLMIAKSVKNVYKKGIFYRNLGAKYLEIGDVDKGEKYTRVALLYTKLNPEVYINLGIIYLNIDEYEKARIFLYDSIPNLIDEKSLHEGLPNNQKGLLIYARGIYQQKIGKYDESIKLLEEALGILDVYEKKWEAMATYEIGISYALKGELEQGKAYVEKAIELLDKEESYSSEKALFENTLGEIYTKYKPAKYEDALWAYQRSISYTIFKPEFDVNSLTQNPELSNITLRNKAIIPIANKGRVLIQKYEISKDVKFLNAGIESLELAVDILDELRLYYEGSPHLINMINDRLSFIFDDIIKGYFLLSETIESEDTKEEVLKKAFHASEKSKSYVLFSALVKNNVLQLKSKNDRNNGPAKINNDFIDNLHLINNEISRLRSEGKSLDLFDLLKKNEKLRKEFLVRLKETEPEFFNYMYNNNVIKIEDIQKVLADSQAFIEYYLADEDLMYCFVITQSGFDAYQMYSKQILEIGIQLVESIKKQGIDTLTDKGINRENYINYSHQLYNLILKKALSNLKGINRLVIVPTSTLQYISFDFLLQKKPSTKEFKFKKLDYLVKDYAISYTHSATIFHELNLMELNYKEDIHIYAPEYTGEGVPQSDLNLYVATMEDCSNIFDNVSTLSFAQPDNLQAISNRIQAKSYYWKGKSATKNNFFNHSSDNTTSTSALLFLSMHGCIDENANNSRLLFYSDNGYRDETQALAVSEIYNLNIKSKLTILNSCVTGTSKHQSKSEGFTSIARAFQYAGCPSIVMSRWKVEENASKKIMERLNYYLLVKKYDVDIALQNAKLDYLKLRHEDMYHKPFYWSVFGNLGRTTPIID